MSIFAILFFLFLLVSFLKIYFQETLREAFVKSLVIFFILIYFVVEFLSFFHQLTSTNLEIFTLFSYVVLMALILWKGWKEIKPPFTKETLLALITPQFIVSVLCIQVLFISARYFPPNNWDSMSYHLSRISYWIENQSVAFYPTSTNIQLYSGPLAEYFITYVFLIDKSDNYVFFAQWITMLGSAICISLITKNIFKEKIQLQILSFFIAILVPMGILQSMSTQNDYVVSFFILCTFYFYFSKNNPILVFICFSLAILTKMTAIFYLSVPILFLLIKEIKNKKYFSIFLFGIIFLSFNFLHFSRNFKYFGSPLGPESNDYTLQTLETSFALVNFIKNTSLHLQFPFESWNTFLQNKITNFSQDLSVPINDPKVTYSYAKYSLESKLYHQDYGGGSFFSVIGFFALLFFIFKNKKIQSQKVYVLFLFLGFLLILTMLKWQPWALRLHLPFFLLITPLITLFISRLKLLGSSIQLYFLITAAVCIFYSTLQPIYQIKEYKERDKARFIVRENIYNEYLTASSYILSHKIQSVGVMNNGAGWEYPLWYFIYRENKSVEFSNVFPYKSHANNKNIEAIIDMRAFVQKPLEISFNETTYIKVIKQENLDIYIKK